MVSDSTRENAMEKMWFYMLHPQATEGKNTIWFCTSHAQATKKYFSVRWWLHPLIILSSNDLHLWIQGPEAQKQFTDQVFAPWDQRPIFGSRKMVVGYSWASTSNFCISRPTQAPSPSTTYNNSQPHQNSPNVCLDLCGRGDRIWGLHSFMMVAIHRVLACLWFFFHTRMLQVCLL